MKLLTLSIVGRLHRARPATDRKANCPQGTIMKRKLLVAITLAFASAWSAQAADWDHWRGPERNGVSREKNLPDDWSPEGKNLLWKSDIGGRSTPIILNGRVYLDTRTQHDFNDPRQNIDIQEQVVCFDAMSGKVLWRDVFNVFQTDIPAPRVGWASMVGDKETGNVYVHSVSGLFRCYTPEGKVVWEHSLFEEYGHISGYGGRTQTPIIDEDRVLMTFIGTNWGEYKAPPPKQMFYAFNKRTGAVEWVSVPGGPANDTLYSCPIVAVIKGTRLLIGGNADGGIHAIKARTGEKVWSHPFSKRGLNSSVVVDDGLVYATHGEDNYDNNAYGRIECLDGATGKSVWRVDNIKADYPSPLVHDGILYVVNDSGKLYAFDAKTGHQLWVHRLGTVGKGSPVWADGKLYVMEVNGRISILRPSREKCEKLSEVHLRAKSGHGDDECYATPAIANGRVYFVTRDHIYCIGKPDQTVTEDPVPPLPPEKPKGERIAHLQLVPTEVAINAGDTIAYTLKGYDDNGEFLKELTATLTTKDLPGAKFEADGMKIVTAQSKVEQGGNVLAAAEGQKAAARVRVFPPLPWKWTFDGYKGMQVPVTWQPAFARIKPQPLNGDVVMVKEVGGKGNPSGVIWIGPPTMKGYTIQADVMGREQRRQMPNIGINAQRYNLILLGNTQELEVRTWEPHKRAAKKVPFAWKPDVWYTLKFRVDVEGGKALARGKAWERGKPEPSDWTIVDEDPHPNEIGSPGLYYYGLANSYFDNIEVTESK